MMCQACGVEAETKHVAFHQNIGALVMRFPRWIEGRLCKSCIHKHFWQMTTTTFFLGWWGTISFIVTPFILLNNIFRYIFCLGMHPVQPGATPPQLTEEVVEKVNPHLAEMFTRLNKEEDPNIVSTQIATQAGVTPGQVARLAQVVIQSQQAK